jgi:hypothetical protein
LFCWKGKKSSRELSQSYFGIRKNDEPTVRISRDDVESAIVMANRGGKNASGSQKLTV